MGFKTLTIGTLNARGLTLAKKQAELIGYLEKMQANIICLQETKTESFLLHLPKWKVKFTLDHFKHWGVGIAIRSNLYSSSIKWLDILPGRILGAEINCGSDIFCILSVYLPIRPLEQVKNFIASLNTFLESAKYSTIIIGGDFNSIRGKQLGQTLENIIAVSGLVDAWTKKYGDKLGPTHGKVSRLDKFYVPSFMTTYISDFNIYDCYLSDHRYIEIYLNLSSLTTRLPIWSLPRWMLDDPNYILLVKRELNYWKTKWKEDKTPIFLWWERMKSKIAGLTEGFREENKYKLKKIRQLLKSISPFTNKYQEINRQLERQALYKDLCVFGREVRDTSMRLSNAASWDKEPLWDPWKRLLQKKNTLEISSIQTNKNTITKDSKEILLEFDTYYRCLYSEYIPHIIHDDIYRGMPQVESDLVARLNDPINSKELLLAVQKTANGKAAGLDGIPIEFYKRFWDDLEEPMIELFNEIIGNSKLPGYFTKGYTVLIPKKGNLEDKSNWRPITILNSDYKLFSKIMTARLQPVFGPVIGREQTYTVRGRTMLENLCATRDLVWYARTYNKPLVLASLDQAKAYDQISHAHIEKVLYAIGLPKEVVKLILLCVTGGTTHIAINGRLSMPISIKRGVHQGDPMSGILLSLASEPLANELREVLTKEAFQIGKQKVLMSIYADDVSLFFSNVSAVSKAIRIYKKVGETTGSGLNLNKSRLLVLNIRDLPDTFEDIQIVSTAVKILGVYVGDNKQDDVTLNELIIKLKSEANRLLPLLEHASFCVRVTAINAFITSRVMFIMQIMHFSGKYIDLLNVIIRETFWGKRRTHWIKHDILTLFPEDGGIRLPNFDVKQTALRAKRLNRIIYGQQDSIEYKVVKGLLEESASVFQDIMLFYCSENALKDLKLPPEYKQMWMAITDLQLFSVRPALSEVLKQPVYYNRILINLDIDFSNIRPDPEITSIGSLLLTDFSLRNWDTLKETTKEALLDNWDAIEYNKAIYHFKHEKIMSETTEPWLSWKVQNPETLDDFVFSGVTTKMLYRILNKKVAIPNSVNTRLDWLTLFKPYVPERWANITYRKWHDRLLTPRRALKMGLTMSNICPLCRERNVIDSHIFTECAILQHLKQLIKSARNIIWDAFEVQSSILVYKRLKRHRCHINTAILCLGDYIMYRSYLTRLDNSLKVIKRPSYLFCFLLQEY